MLSPVAASRSLTRVRIEEQKQGLITNKWFKDHELATFRLSITVLLSPSCRSCAIHIHVQKVKHPEKQRIGLPSLNSYCKDVPSPVNRTKRRRKNEDMITKYKREPSRECDKTEGVCSVNAGHNCPDEELKQEEMSYLSQELQPNKVETFTEERMKVEEILERFSRALPEAIYCDHTEGSGEVSTIINERNSVIVENDYLFETFGVILKEYSRKVKASLHNNNDRFVICLANGKDAQVAAYHNSVQKLSKFFIGEGHSYVLALTLHGWR